METRARRPDGTTVCRFTWPSAMLIVLTLVASPALAQTLVAVDDEYGVSFADPLVVEEPGVMSNDTYGGVPAAGEGAEVTLLTYPDDGVIDCESDPGMYDLCPDGSFIYTPGSSFSGFDSFTYEVAHAGQTDQATVTLTACTGGPAQYVCWQESAYLAQLGALGGYQLIHEGFEDDVAWGVTRDPLTEPSVVSQGVRWETNHFDPPASNELITGPGPARSGLWGLYDPEHGYATGTPTECDINDPPPHCLFKDGFTGTRESGDTMLYGAGGYLKGAAQPNLVMYLDGGAPIGLGRLSVGGHQFFGVIDTGGFSSFRIEETDGKVGQERYVFGDDFILATTTVDGTPPQVTLVNTWYDTGDGVLAEGEITDTAIFQLLVSFSEPVRDVFGNTDPHDVTNPANYLLVSDGGDGFETASCSGGVAGNDVQVAVDWVSWEGSPVMTATLDLNGGVDLGEGSYRLLVCGTTSIHDWAGNPLDGDGNGTGGDDFERNFTIYYPPNDPPTADPQSVSTAEDTALGIVLTGSDPNSDPLTFSIVTGPAHGGLTGVPPTVTYTPGMNYHGPDSFTFRVFDGELFSDPATVSITVTPVNDVPLAVDDSATTDEDTAISIAVLGNDDLGDPPTTITAVTQGTNGAVVIDPGATTVTYAPNADYNGLDSFTYTITDADLETSTATVSMTVNPINDEPVADAGPDQTVFVTNTVNLDGSGSSDVDGDPLTFAWSFTSVPVGSTASLSDPTAVMPTFVIDEPGDYVVELVVDDGTVPSAPDTVTISTDNSPPVADAGPDQSALVTETVTLDGSGSSDVDGDALTYAWSFTSVPPGSAASLSDPTAVMPTFVIDEPGAYVVELIVHDGTVPSAPDTVTISTENSAPVADAGPDQTAFVTDTVMLDGSGSSDVDGDPLTFGWSFTSVPAGSTAALSDPTAVMPTFVIDEPGAYVVQLIVHDGTVPSAPDTVTISTDNSAPVANDQSVSTAEDTSLGITLTGSDPDGDPIMFAIGTGPTHGGLTGTPPDMIYTPGTNYHGPDSFTFTTNDGILTSLPATVSITVTPVNDPPTADDQSVSTPEDTALGITLTGSDPDGDPLTFAIGTGPTHGALTGAPPNVTYTPTADYHGPDSFTFTTNDGVLTSLAATVSITVTPVNDAPVADAGPDQSALVTETVTLDGSGSSDVDGDALTFAWSFTSVPVGSIASLSDPTAVMPTFVVDLPGDYIVQLIVHDGTVPSAPDTVTISTDNSPPVAEPQSVSTPQDTALPITLTGSDPDGDPISFAIGTGPTHGALTGTPPNVTYTPAPGYFGPDSFTFTVFDGQVSSDPATVSITVTEVALPELTIENTSIVEGDSGPTPVDVTITLTPASGSSVSVDWATGDGTATAGSDYTASAGTANFAAGATTATVPLEILGDLTDEPDETFDVALSNPVGAVLGAPSTATVTIIDDDPMPELSGADLMVFEWVGDAQVELSLSAASGYDISVDYATVDGTATAPEDYTAVSGTAFIAAGASSTTVPVPIVEDTVTDPDEFFTLELSNPTNAVLMTSAVTVTIQEDGSLLFRDGFETGDLSAWSAVAP